VGEILRSESPASFIADKQARSDRTGKSWTDLSGGKPNRLFLCNSACDKHDCGRDRSSSGEER
jgi:hypothetical protein